MRLLPTLLVAVVLVGGGLAWRLSTSDDRAPMAPLPAQPVMAGIPQGHVYTGCVEEPDDVNPLTAHAQVARRLILAYTHEGLLDVDPQSGALRPAVAGSFAPSPDLASCLFTLREGVQFADGSPVTLDDVMFAWQLASAGPEGRGHASLGFIGDAFARVQKVERLGDQRFRVHFRDRHYAALRIVGETWLVVKKQFFVDRVAARCAPAAAPAVDSPEFAQVLGRLKSECGPGTGPYQLVNDPAGVLHWRPRQDLLLVRNEHSWRRQAAPGTWNFAGIRLLFRDEGGANHALLRGEVDWYTSLTLGELLKARPELLEQYRRLLYDYDALGVYRVVWNCRRRPADDPRVRRALGMLFDVEGLRRGSEDLGPRAVAHAKPGTPAWPADLVPLAFDPAAARRLLREAGFDPAEGKPLRLVVVALQGTEVLRRIADLFASAAKDAGIELDLRRRGLSGFVQEKKAGDWDGLLVQQSFRPWGDPWDLLHSRGADNDGKWADAEADRLADAARAEADPEVRAGLWRQLHTIVYREQPAALLAHPMAAVLLHRRIEAAVPGRSGLVLERAHVAPAAQRR